MMHATSSTPFSTTGIGPYGAGTETLDTTTERAKRCTSADRASDRANKRAASSNPSATALSSVNRYHATCLRPALPTAYHDLAPVLARFLGPDCPSAEHGGCVWFTRYGPGIGNHRCSECGSMFCDVHHTVDMCTECTGMTYCLACLGKYGCYVGGCERSPVDLVHGYHAHYGGCVAARHITSAWHTYVYSGQNKFACSEHKFKRTHDHSRTLIAHSYDCNNSHETPPPKHVAQEPRSQCVLQ